MPTISNLPTITSITATDPTQTDAGTVHYTVTFSKPVLGVAADQFSLALTGGIGGAGITDVSPVAGSNGASYTVTVNTGSGSGSVALQFTGTNVRDSSGYYVGPFQSETALITNPPTSIAVGDVNGDGKLDIVTGGTFAFSIGYLEVALNDGTGHFSSVSSERTGDVFALVTLADLNGDGKLDLAQVTSAGLKVRFGNGDGTFGAATSYAAGGAYQTPKVIDVTGDGVSDIVIGSTVLPGNGNGTFGTAITTSLGASSIAYGDFNGDGKLDLVTRNSSSAIALSFGNGDGTFQAPSSQVGTATTVVTGDFNGDGKLDMAAVSGTGISILLGNGDGTFSSSGTLQAGATIGSGAVADVTGDGKADLMVVTTNNTLVTFYGHGDGTFGPARVSPLDKTAGQIGVGDLNGDGKADILVGYQFGSGFNQSTGTDILLSGSSNESGPAYTIVRTSPALAITDADVTPGTDGKNYINAAHFNGGATTLTGAGNAGDIISVSDAVTHAIVGTATVGRDGTWRLGVSGLHDGTYSYVASTTDTQGNGTFGPAFTFTVDTTAPVLAITSVVNSDATSNLVNIRGTLDLADAPATLTVSYGGTNYTVTSTDGAWHLDNLSPVIGISYVTAQLRDAAGNLGVSQAIPLVRSSNLPGGTSLTNAYVMSGSTLVMPGPGALPGTSTVGTTILRGASVVNYGVSTGAVIENGGTETVAFGGRSFTATILAGGSQGIVSGTATDAVLFGYQQITNSGNAVHTEIKAGGQQIVDKAGTSRNTLIDAFGVQFVAAGANDFNATNAGTQWLSGTSAGMVIVSGGVQNDFGTAIGVTVASGGKQQVYGGGSADTTTVVAGGFQGVANATVTNTVLSGDQQVQADGHATGTTINAGGRQYVGSGGQTANTVITTGGLQYVDAGAADSNATINGGFQFVAGAASGASVSGGGEQDVGSGGTATNTHVDGGSEHVYAGGLLQNVDFGGSNGAMLWLDAPAGLAGSIANFGADDYIDFRNTVVSSVAVDGSNNLTVTTDGGQSYSWALLAQYSASSFVLSADGNGGTLLSYQPPQQAQLAAAH
ncbi:FG-GAP-like repeat-containing protein [Bradyrhizobium betae]|nr:FG-GAP-like repeat-containing protein [Bradyrhizobium betae]